MLTQDPYDLASSPVFADKFPPKLRTVSGDCPPSYFGGFNAAATSQW